MVEQGSRAAMADPETRVAIADPGTRAAMADQGEDAGGELHRHGGRLVWVGYSVFFKVCSSVTVV